MDSYIITSGFFKYNIILVGIFAIITFLVSLFSYKLYRLTNQKQIRLFSASFFAFSAAYIIQFIINVLIVYKIIDGLSRFEMMHVIIPLRGLAGYIYALLFIIGFAVLAYMSLRIENKKVLVLILGMAFIPMLLTPHNILLFHVLSSLLLVFIVLFYLKNYSKHHQIQSLLVLVAFVFLLLGHFSLIFSIQSSISFVTGRLLELAAYMCILVNLILTIKK